ncbi:MAG: CHAT domain-containing protein [Betaproteobacteria bacterium]
MDPANGTGIRVTGLPLPATTGPRALSGRARGGDGMADPFLPAGFVEVVQAWDLSPTARDIAREEPAIALAEDGEVIVLELGEGVSVFLSPASLRETLLRLDPGAAADGVVDLEALRRHQDASRGWLADSASGLVERVFRLRVGAVADPILEAAQRRLAGWLGHQATERLKDFAELGVTWLGTKALMAAIESRLLRDPGLYRWTAARGAASDLEVVDDARLEADARQGPLLVFIHGTGSNSSGSFGDLRNVSQADWEGLERRFHDRVYAFEHRTFSESPIDNALALARSLPAGAQLDIVTHSRGGLVGDFLCLEDVDLALADACFGRGATRSEAWSEHRARLEELAIVLREKRFAIGRYVRVASPARGTRLASANFDVFLSGLLSLIGLVPALAGSPVYSALKRIVLEIARNRTRPELVPGIEAMLPESPVGRFLAGSAPRSGMELGVIAGDIEGGGLLKKLGVLFTDIVFFDRMDNDLVVDTDAMYAGVARPGQAWSRFEQGPLVNHFRYFENPDSRAALVEWLTVRDLALIGRFEPLPVNPADRSAVEQFAADRAVMARRGGERAVESLPVVVVLPGIMGSHLRLGSRNDRIWFDPLDIARGGLERLSWQGEQDDVVAESLFDRTYGALCEHLLATHRVERFPYDWRKPVAVAARALAQRLETLLAATRSRPVPIRLLAHSMGGLVVRTMIAERPDLWDEINNRDGARFVMLGTPNQGSHSMVATLLGKDDTVRKLARLVDMKHDLQQLLDIIKEFRGALQLLPRPGFEDAPGSAVPPSYFDAALWGAFRGANRDFWFGNGIVGVPTAAALAEAAGVWAEWPDLAQARLPGKHRDRILYVCGVADTTPCGVRLDGDRWRMLGCGQGDGTVTWRSGLIDGLEEGRNVFFMRAAHGALADTEDAFPALVDLLEEGTTARTRVLSMNRPGVRGVDRVVPMEPGPVPFPTVDEVADNLAGPRPPRRARPVARPVLQVSCAAMDLREASSPILVGHYEQDAISGAEALIDRELVGNELTLRHHLGLYAGRLGTATVVLLSRNDEERRRGSARGAVVAGLGELGSLSMGSLTEAVRTATLRYLLQLVDNQGADQSAPPEDRSEIALSSLLLGHNSTTNITIEDSVGAIVRGVLEANRQFGATMKQPLRVSRLELVEMYLDTAIAATRALQRVAVRLNAEAARHGVRVEAQTYLTQREGWRYRLDAPESNGYWPRLIVTDAQPGEAAGGQPGSARVAQRLRFLYLAQRARAESVENQRQPGVVEALVATSVARPAYSEDLSRTLFQLLVPNDFKELARQLSRLVLVVDACTANLPWELMLADEEPLCVRTRVVRQLASGNFRTRVRQAIDATAYVVGNPATQGFGKVFRGPGGTPFPDPPVLGGAEAEARAVAGVLAGAGFHVTEAIGPEASALDVINKLYQRSYRIIHIAAHGVFEQEAADGSLRTGAVLSDGVLLTAAEIESMEVVPDLVFLNCCHLAQSGGPGTVEAFHRLAYSVSRQLIEMGVRAVVAAGWAVDDQAAEFFATEFYAALLQENKPLGEAAFQARVRTYERFRNATNTWGAYQVYGDPGFLAQPQETGERLPGSRSTRGLPVAPEELLGALERVSGEVAAMPGRITVAAASVHASRAAELLRQSPEHWLDRPDVNFALGELYGALGAPHGERAREHLRAAVHHTARGRPVPTRALEELASLEARLAESRDANAGGTPESAGSALRALAEIDGAIARLQRLCEAADERAPGAGPVPGSQTPEMLNLERAALFGSMYKRKAAILARHLLAGDPTVNMDGLIESLDRSVQAYRTAASVSGAPDYRPYLALHAIGLWGTGLTRGGSPKAGEVRAALAEVRACRQRAYAAYLGTPDVWNAVLPADASLLESLLNGELGAAGDIGQQVTARLRACYADALRSVRTTPRDLDAIVKQLCLLQLFLQVRTLREAGASARDAASAERAARALRELANQVQPGSCESLRATPISAKEDAMPDRDSPSPGPGVDVPSDPPTNARKKRTRPSARPDGTGRARRR